MAVEYVEITNWYATRRHLATVEYAAAHPESVRALCSLYTRGVTKETYLKRCAQQGRTPRQWETIPECKLCQRVGVMARPPETEPENAYGTPYPETEALLAAQNRDFPYLAQIIAKLGKESRDELARACRELLEELD